MPCELETKASRYAGLWASSEPEAGTGVAAVDILGIGQPQHALVAIKVGAVSACLQEIVAAGAAVSRTELSEG